MRDGTMGGNDGVERWGILERIPQTPKNFFNVIKRVVIGRRMRNLNIGYTFFNALSQSLPPRGRGVCYNTKCNTPQITDETIE